jgi:hypothetical protein
MFNHRAATTAEPESGKCRSSEHCGQFRVAANPQ